MRVPLILGMMAVVAFGTSERALSQAGNEFAPKNKMFTITLPAGEKAQERTRVLTIGKHKVPIEASESMLPDGTSYLGASVGIPAVVMREIPANQRFDILRDAIMKQVKGKVLKEKFVKKDVVPGKEYQIQLENGAARMQIYTIAGFVVYAIVEGKTKEDVNGKQADAFYKSLKMTEAAKEVFLSVGR